MIKRTKMVICLLMISLLVGTVSADRFVVSVRDSYNNAVSGALVEISACSLTTSCTTTGTGTCTFDVQNPCNDINVYVNGNLKWSGKFQPRVNIKV